MDREKGYQQLDDQFGHPFVSLAAFCSHRQPYGLGYNIDVVEAIQQETRQMLLHETVQEAMNRKEQGQLAAQQTTGNVLPKHIKPDSQFANHTQAARAQANGVSKRQQEKLDRLARDYPALHACVISGELSTHAAAKAAGIVKDPTPLTQLRRLWKKATPDERATFLADITAEHLHA